MQAIGLPETMTASDLRELRGPELKAMGNKIAQSLRGKKLLTDITEGKDLSFLQYMTNAEGFLRKDVGINARALEKLQTHDALLDEWARVITDITR